METASISDVKQHIGAGNKIAEETAGQTNILGESIKNLDPSVLADGIDALATNLEARVTAAEALPYPLIEEKRVEAHDTAAQALAGTSTDFAELGAPHEAMKKANGEGDTSRTTFATVLGEVAVSYREAATRLREEASGHVAAAGEKAVAAGVSLNSAKESATKYSTNL